MVNQSIRGQLIIGRSMLILDGKTLANKKFTDLKPQVVAFETKWKRKPKLAVIIVGDDPASHVYVNNKKKACEKVGMDSEIIFLESRIKKDDLMKKISELNEDPSVDGFLVQMPLPGHLKDFEPTDYIRPEKDVDGLSSLNMGLMVTGKAYHEPCTPEGVMELLSYYQVELSGKSAVVVGRSKTVGWPMAYMLTRAGCTVTVCHSKTPNVSDWTRKADIVVVAAGKPHLLKGSDFKKGATIVDVGIHKNPNGKGLVGDVDFTTLNEGEVKAVSPVPGGVGPMTVAQLISHTLMAAKNKLEAEA